MSTPHRAEWLEPPTPALAQAAESYFLALRRPAERGDRLHLWLRSAKDGRAVGEALGVYAAARGTHSERLAVALEAEALALGLIAAPLRATFAEAAHRDAWIAERRKSRGGKALEAACQAYAAAIAAGGAA